MKAILGNGPLRICRALGLFWLARQLKGRSLVILGYHGFELADEDVYKYSLFMSERTLTARLDSIRRMGFSVLQLPEALELLDRDMLPRNALCITIDDGFYATYAVAAPALLRLQMPATVYTATYYVETQNPVFRLTVQYMFGKTRLKRLEIRDRDWADNQVVDLTDSGSFDRLVAGIVRYGMDRCDEAGREMIARELGDLLDVDYGWIKRTRLLSLMNPAEIRDLASKGMDIELHTHTHRFPQDSEQAAKQEIRRNRAILEHILGRPVDHFCYPNGLWARHQWVWLEDLGIKSATICQPGLNRKDSPRFALRRLVDSENISQVRFEAEISGFIEVARRLKHLFRRGA
jgi:peptidoglycan/xylan/chitin deacetylase (PgdA/CDA1 family)